MVSKTKLEIPKQIVHRPFVIRKTIVLSALVFAIGGGIFLGTPVLGIALYFGLVTFFDGISHYVLQLKSSDFADPEELLESERVTAEELDYYFDTRRYIRMASFGFGCLAFAVYLVYSFYPLETFCVAYVLTTIAEILYVRFFLKIARPRLIYRDASCGNTSWLSPRPFGAYADFALWSTGHNVPLRL